MGYRYGFDLHKGTAPGGIDAKLFSSMSTTSTAPVPFLYSSNHPLIHPSVQVRFEHNQIETEVSGQYGTVHVAPALAQPVPAKQPLPLPLPPPLLQPSYCHAPSSATEPLRASCPLDLAPLNPYIVASSLNPYIVASSLNPYIVAALVLIRRGNEIEKLAPSEASSGSQGGPASDSSVSNNSREKLDHNVASFKDTDDAQKTALVQAEVQRMKRTSVAGSESASNRLKVLDKMLHLIGKVRTSTEGEELELLFANMNF